MVPPVISASSRLDGFSESPIQASHIDSWNQVFEPQNSIQDGSPITFLIPPSPEFINLSRTKLKIKVKIIKSGGGNLVAADNKKVALACNSMHSLFKHVTLKVGDTIVTPSGDQYPYKAFIDTLFSSTLESKHTWDLSGFHLDTEEDAVTTNLGFKKRASSAMNSVEMEFSGRPALDILKTGINVIDNVKLEFNFYPNDNAFVLHKSTGYTGDVKFKITDAQLSIRKEQLDPSTVNAIHKALLKKNWALPYSITTTKLYNLPADSYQFNANNVFQGKIPNFILIYFVKASSYTGNYHKNPFFFSPHDSIKEIIVTKNGQLVPSAKPNEICIDFTSPKGLRVIDTYESLLDVMGYSGLVSKGLVFPPERLAGGLFFSATNFQPDTENDDHISLEKNGNIDIQIKFGEAIPEAYEMFVTGDFDTKTEINTARNVLHTFKQ